MEMKGNNNLLFSNISFVFIFSDLFGIFKNQYRKILSFTFLKIQFLLLLEKHKQHLHVQYGFHPGTLLEELISYAIGINVENCRMLNTRFMHLDIDFVKAK